MPSAPATPTAISSASPVRSAMPTPACCATRRPDPRYVDPMPLTRAHRSWRIKVFAATWLSYVGFYFCRKPFSAAKSAIGAEFGWDAVTLGNIWAAYLIAYAIGQFLAARMGTLLG